MSDIFISYSHKDRIMAGKLSEALERHGYSVWFDRNLETGVRWNREIINQVLSCHIMVVLLSPDAVESEWVRLESSLAIGAGKLIMPIALTPNLPIPEYLGEFQVSAYVDESTFETLARRIAREDLSGRFWLELFENGLDICLPLEKLGEVAGVNQRALVAALDVQNRLLHNFNPLLTNPNALTMPLIQPEGQNLNARRNWLILGGPGGVPFVTRLLQRWTGAMPETYTGYRFVTGAGRFRQSAFLRDATDDRLGIEDLHHGSVRDFYEVAEPTHFADGNSYAVLFTAGFSKQEAMPNRVIILAAFSRHVLDGTVGFLFDNLRRSEWLAEVESCGACTETLVSFTLPQGRLPEYAGRGKPRTLPKPAD